MNINQLIYSLPFLILMIWSLFWKGWALWKAAQNNQKQWFIAILIINSVGLLELVYLLFFQKKGRYWEKVVAKFKKE